MVATVTFKDIKDEIFTQLSKATHSIKLAVAWLTDEDIIRLLSQRQEKGVAVQIVICDSTENFKKNKQFNKLLRSGGGMCVATSPFMHHKFCIIDDKVILNGSYNWSYPAQRNNENLLTIIPDLKIREDKLLLLNFKSEFISLFNSSNRINEYMDLDFYSRNNKDVPKLQAALEEWETLLRHEFEDEVMQSINKSREIGIIQYYTSLLERMESDGGGVLFAKRLILEEIASGIMKPGFKRLESHFPPQIELSIEYLVAKPKFEKLFTSKEIDFCSGVMRQYGITYN